MLSLNTLAKVNAAHRPAPVLQSISAAVRKQYLQVSSATACGWQQMQCRAHHNQLILPSMLGLGRSSTRCTCECLVQLVSVLCTFQQASDGDDHMLKAWSLAGILTPACLQHHQMMMSQPLTSTSHSSIKSGKDWCAVSMVTDPEGNCSGMCDIGPSACA